MGVATNFNEAEDCENIAKAFQFTDLLFTVDAFENGQTVLPTNFSQAEYLILDLDGNTVISKTIGDGIELESKGLLIKVDDLEMTFEGNYLHQFRLFNLSGDKMPPVFLEPLQVLKTY